jgi:hypothetical protein
MSGNPAIHRRPSGDVDIAVPVDEPEAPRETSVPGPNNAPGDTGFSPPTTDTE